MDAWAVAFGFTGLFGLDRAAVVFLAAGLDFAAVVDFGFAAVFGFAVVLGLEAAFDVAVDFDFAAAFGFDLPAVDFAAEPFDDPTPVRVRGLLCPDLLVAILFPFWSIWPPRFDLPLEPPLQALLVDPARLSGPGPWPSRGRRA